MKYNELDINQRINLKATLMAFKKFAVKDWQREIEQKVYKKRGVRITSKDGFKASRIITRTGALRREWDSSLIQSVAGLSVLRFQFPMYGRFNDMGVGKGTSFADQQYSRSRYGRRIGDGEARKPTRWYSKRKGYNQHRMAELLTKRYGLGMTQFVENQLTFTVGINL